MVELSDVSGYLKGAGQGILDMGDKALCTFESGCDATAYYGGYAFSKGTDFCSPVTDKVIELWQHYTRPFWNASALIYRYPLSAISWHFPKTILWLEGQKKLEQDSPLYQKVDKIAKEMNLSQTPDVYLKDPKAFSFLPEGGWGSIFQSAVVVTDNTSDALIKRSLKAAQYNETSLQSLDILAGVVGLHHLGKIYPMPPAIQLAALVGFWVLSYVGMQFGIDQAAAKSTSIEERADLKAHLNRSKIEALPEKASVSAKAERLASVLLSGPSYLRSLVL